MGLKAISTGKAHPCLVAVLASKWRPKALPSLTMARLPIAAARLPLMMKAHQAAGMS